MPRLVTTVGKESSSQYEQAVATMQALIHPGLNVATNPTTCHYLVASGNYWSWILTKKEWIALGQKIDFESFEKMTRSVDSTEAQAKHGFANSSTRARHSYNVVTRRFTIKMPSSLHESIIGSLHQALFRAMESLPVDVQMRLDIRTYLKWPLDHGERPVGKKVPDLALIIHRNPCWILEVGFSQPYDDLVEDARQWLEDAPTVKAVMLVKMTEQPPFRSPIHSRDLADVNLEAWAKPSEMFDAIVADHGRQPFGPVIFSGQSWTGGLSEVWSEWWVRDDHGRPVRQGGRQSLLGPNASPISLPIGAFLPIVGVQTPPLSVEVSIQQVQAKLEVGITYLAMERYSDLYAKVYELQNTSESSVDSGDFRDSSSS
ncbi:MAG: hypothetical protein M1826_005722 [Phylliscum demangeonii]|nr:MAG: hypothetical protein M1826_005722 [Phylliscum demangeonii]